jgi:hypothetical protein
MDEVGHGIWNLRYTTLTINVWKQWFHDQRDGTATPDLRQISQYLIPATPKSKSSLQSSTKSRKVSARIVRLEGFLRCFQKLDSKRATFNILKGLSIFLKTGQFHLISRLVWTGNILTTEWAFDDFSKFLIYLWRIRKRRSIHFHLPCSNYQPPNTVFIIITIIFQQLSDSWSFPHVLWCTFTLNIKFKGGWLGILSMSHRGILNADLRL